MIEYGRRKERKRDYYLYNERQGRKEGRKEKASNTLPMWCRPRSMDCPIILVDRKYQYRLLIIILEMIQSGIRKRFVLYYANQYIHKYIILLKMKKKTGI